METWTAALFHKTGLILGEGIRWHQRWQKFLFIDIKGKLAGVIDPIDKKIQLVQLSQMPGMLSPTDDDDLLIALQGELAILDFKTGELTTLINIEQDKPNNRSNDGACDALGRLWLGTMDVNATLNQGNLYCYDGKLEKKIANTSVSNGIGWSADHKTLYYIDSFTYNIKAFDYNLSTAQISNERIVVEIIDQNTVPDGMCIDEEGMLWVAIWGGGCVNRYDPKTGDCIGKVEVEAPNVTSCAFGGPNMQTLLISTASDGLSIEEVLRYPHSGSLFMVELSVKGLPTHVFKK